LRSLFCIFSLMNNLNTNQYKMAAKVTRSTINAFGGINLEFYMGYSIYYSPSMLLMDMRMPIWSYCMIPL
jgi:hypothetical protein